MRAEEGADEDSEHSEGKERVRSLFNSSKNQKHKSKKG
jgi:hypothetical protein